MKYAFDPEVESFREEVRAFIKEALPDLDPDRPGEANSGHTNEEIKAYTMGFQKKLAEKGWLAMAWPKEYGGGGASHMRQTG